MGATKMYSCGHGAQHYNLQDWRVGVRQLPCVKGCDRGISKSKERAMTRAYYHLNNVITITAVITMSAAALISGAYDRYMEEKITENAAIIGYLLTKDISELGRINYKG